MCQGDDMEILFIGVTAVATSFAAFSAWCSYRVSRESLKFQKIIAKNQNKTIQFNNVLIKLCSLKRLQKNVLDLSDDEFSSIEGIFDEVLKQLEELSSISDFNWKLLELSKCTDAALLNDTILNEAIQKVETHLFNLWS